VRFHIDADIRRAETLPGAVYRDPELHQELIARVFAPSWQLAPDADAVERHNVVPFALLPGCLDEPLLLTREQGQVRCLSNVCTHRGTILCEKECESPSLRCPYHGRRFGLDGKLAHAPEFEGAIDFPSERDHLARLPLERLGPLQFTSVAPSDPLAVRLEPLTRRLKLPFEKLRLDPASARDYDVAANWMLYVDNYLEGLHIPFVHPALSTALDFGAYKTELDPLGTVQIGIAKPGEDTFDGSDVAGWYFWWFPNLMLNFYPWGLSLNVVTPLAVDKTRVHFRAYVLDESRRARGAGSALDRVELEDEQVVEAVQRGVRSRIYRRGRYSPSRETGVHHFHRLLESALAR
jgi:choline monooxygenase